MVGKTIGHYHILEELGRGGMGVVYRARDTKLGRDVALKFLPRDLVSTEEEQMRFRQEAQAAATLNHPNICTIHAIMDHEGWQFIDMELVEGATLRKKLPVRDLNEAVAYTVQIGEALQEAHNKGIVHRDVKADNIMINMRNQVKVMDFGLAKLRGSGKLTRASSTVGTIAYMAPEQIQGGEVDARSDIFSLGVLLFEMLTGKLPFRGEHDAAIMYSVLNEDPDDLLKHRADLPTDLGRIVRRALEKDPADRYQHVDDLLSEIRYIRKQTGPLSRSGVPADSGRGTMAPAPEQPGRGAARGRVKIISAAIVVVLLALAGAAYYFMSGTASSFDSLAVLPFINAGGDPTTEYLSDGMTENIINSLTRIPQLRVVPRSTVFRFKGKDTDPQEIGTHLGVSAVLAGRVVQRDNELNVQLDLIDVRSQSQVWGEQYRRRADEVITLQQQIVADVSRQLRLVLSGETQEQLSKRVTENPQAYNLYLQGRYFWQKRRAVELRKATEYFNQAIAADPGFALAYAGLADCYLLMPQYAGQPWREIAPLAGYAAEKALELDGSLGEAHAALGFIKMEEWDWAGAEREFKMSIEMNPKYPTAYHWYSLLLTRTGRGSEAFDVIQRALELDPLSPIILLNVALLYDRHKDDMKTAMELLRKSLDLDAGFAPAYHWMGRIQVRRGLREEGLANLQKGVDLTSRASENLASLGYALAVMGRKDEARKILAELKALYDQKKTAAYNVAKVYAGLKDKEKMFEFLQRDYEDHSGWMTWLGVDAEWSDYASDPRFIALLKNIGLEQQ
jgi:TolB-like protein/Flp pilus assembly protein TadD